ERFSLDGNPAVDQLWTTTTLDYLDETRTLQLMTMPLTPAEFALGEVRFAKQFRWLAVHEEAAAVPIAEFIELAPEQRLGKIPFVYATDRRKQLVRMACSAAIVELVEERKRHWQLLQFLAGQSEAALTAQHRAELEALTARYGEAVDAREQSLDTIAQAMADLATSSGAPVGGPLQLGLGMPGPFPAPAAVPAAATTAVAERPIWLAEEDLPRCNDCATCYQELPQLFEKATVVIDGAPRTVGRMREGSLDNLEVTPELAARIARVKATCDAEIIQ
ncbi:MAG: hypothetical protein VB036_01295, partial [Propionicimonas sp.]|nr:hypothetical protein [Propionicimonas sp.]